MPTPTQLQVYTLPKTNSQTIQNWGSINTNFLAFLSTIEELFGFGVQTLTANSTLAAGEVVYASGSGTVDLAVATSAAASDVVGIARAAITSAASGEIQTEGVVTVTGWGLTAGSLYYLSASTPGALTTTAPSTAGQYVKPLGVALTAEKLSFDPQLGILL